MSKATELKRMKPAGKASCPLAQARRQRVSDAAQCYFTAGDGTEWAEGGLRCGKVVSKMWRRDTLYSPSDKQRSAFSSYQGNQGGAVIALSGEATGTALSIYFMN
jgi:hypothetical protein